MAWWGWVALVPTLCAAWVYASCYDMPVHAAFLVGIGIGVLFVCVVAVSGGLR